MPPARDTIEVEALITDRYLDSLLATGAAAGAAAATAADAAFGWEGGDLDRGVRAASLRLRRDLPRFHPSFRFEERLALRLAEAGEIDLARRHFEAALARTLPVESRRFLTFHLAKLEAQYGAPSAALTGLAELQSWSTTRVDMLDDVLQVQAAAQARLGDYHSAYHTLLNMVQAIQIRHDEELSVQLKVVEAVHRTEETRRNAEALLHRQGAG